MLSKKFCLVLIKGMIETMPLKLIDACPSDFNEEEKRQKIRDRNDEK